jgi:hypothetical protein
MTNLRMWHSYLSVLVAPSILFFALTGALQLFSLHEAHEGYQPPVLIEKLGRLHKDQVFAVNERHEPPPQESRPASSPPDAAAHGEQEDEPRAATWVLKWFFLAVAVVLMLSTCLGLWIALTHLQRKRLSALLFLVGALLPVGLLVFTP